MSTEQELHDLDTAIAHKLLHMEPCDAWKRTYAGAFAEDRWSKNFEDCDHVFGKCYPAGHPAKYSSDLRATKMVEDEIDHRGLWYEYIEALLGSTWPTLIDVEQAWVLLRYSPEHRCRAALRAIENLGGGK